MADGTQSGGRDVWITGIGLASSLGEGLDAHWAALTAAQPKPAVDLVRFAPYPVHPMVPLDLDRQIPKKGDQRQMEPWQRIGVHAAGLALDMAGVAHDGDLLLRTHMIVAAGGGERDIAADEGIMAGLAAGEDLGRFLNERLAGDLRPTLFLAQLSNLLAGNISIVHGVVGSSRTFMGEESAGVEALRVAAARIAAGQGDLFLVGGASNAERKDMLLLHELGRAHLKDEWEPVWSRGAKGGMVTGSLGAFLVLEARAHAEARGAVPLARLAGVVSDRTSRIHGAVTEAGLRMWRRLASSPEAKAKAVLSGATGVEPATREERAFLDAVLTPTGAVRATGTMLGHAVEAQFPANVALAALALSRGGFYPPFDESGIERPAEAAVDEILVTGFGHWRGEGLALVGTAR